MTRSSSPSSAAGGWCTPFPRRWDKPEGDAEDSVGDRAESARAANAFPTGTLGMIVEGATELASAVTASVASVEGLRGSGWCIGECFSCAVLSSAEKRGGEVDIVGSSDEEDDDADDSGRKRLREGEGSGLKGSRDTLRPPCVRTW